MTVLQQRIALQVKTARHYARLARQQPDGYAKHVFHQQALKLLDIARELKHGPTVRYEGDL